MHVLWMLKLEWSTLNSDGNHYVKLICRRNACRILKSSVHLCAYPTDLRSSGAAKKEQHILLDIHYAFVGILSISPSWLYHYTHGLNGRAKQRIHSIFYFSCVFFFSQFNIAHICPSTSKFGIQKGRYIKSLQHCTKYAYFLIHSRLPF